MTPYYADDWLTVHQGDWIDVLREMPAESVHCVVTSPPYWGLRDYGTSGQLGLEPTPEEYVAKLVEGFREVRRVLRSDGTLWCNMGDSYATGTTSDRGPTATGKLGLKPKDLVGIPWRVAFALQADGWYLRSDIIWSKPNPMPESVTDRPTKSHEYLFLLSRSPRYYFDADAVREPAEFAGPNGAQHSPYGQGFTRRSDKQREMAASAGGATERRMSGFNDRWDESERNGTAPLARNIRSVWTVATQPYPGAHFATFPRKLVEPCIKAGTSERGVCPECGAPWERVVERQGTGRAYERGTLQSDARALGQPQRSGAGSGALSVNSTTAGWRPTCSHGCLACEKGETAHLDLRSFHGAPVPATVLDPFAGSGTTGLVAQSLGRRAVLIDLNAEYLTQAMERNRDIPLGLGA